MSKFVDISLAIAFFIASIILWLYVLLISSDIPVNISKNEFVISLMSLLLFGILYSFYIKNSKREVMGMLLLIPLGFWIPDIINAIKYNYQIYNTILSVIGFCITVYCIGVSIYKLIVYNKII
ncbi:MULTISPECIES: hypothetical protein [unclassified Clostridium]|uniref:hypothetical protein n=1 Tax=unclassified Clostridium TaxID=2614128 RepID=UPI00207AA909|nr:MULTISPECIES: hypothetical protein [unclassified Clostridium]